MTDRHAGKRHVEGQLQELRGCKETRRQERRQKSGITQRRPRTICKPRPQPARSEYRRRDRHGAPSPMKARSARGSTACTQLSVGERKRKLARHISRDGERRSLPPCAGARKSSAQTEKSPARPSTGMTQRARKKTSNGIDMDHPRPAGDQNSHRLTRFGGAIQAERRKSCRASGMLWYSARTSRCSIFSPSDVEQVLASKEMPTPPLPGGSADAPGQHAAARPMHQWRQEFLPRSSTVRGQRKQAEFRSTWPRTASRSTARWSLCAINGIAKQQQLDQDAQRKSDAIVSHGWRERSAAVRPRSSQGREKSAVRPSPIRTGVSVVSGRCRQTRKILAAQTIERIRSQNLPCRESAISVLACCCLRVGVRAAPRTPSRKRQSILGRHFRNFWHGWEDRPSPRYGSGAKDNAARASAP